jgi:hypothetical protein
MISVPNSSYDGAFNFVADKTYPFTKPTSDSPDITFQYNPETKLYEVKYIAIDLLVPFKLLIKDSEGTLYTVSDDMLVPMEETELTAQLFQSFGFEKMPDWNLIKSLDTPSVLSWSDSRAFPLTALITGTPPKQYVECTADLSDGTVLEIKALNAEYSCKVTEQHSFDGESFTDEIPIDEFLTSDLDELFAGLTESKTITFRFWLSGDATLTTFVMTYRNGDDDNA